MALYQMFNCHKSNRLFFFFGGGGGGESGVVCGGDFSMYSLKVSLGALCLGSVCLREN
jgi:hypothetical protein